MTPKVVFRIGKLKTWAQVSSAASHNLRTRPTPNAGAGGIVEVVPMRHDSAIHAVQDKIGDQKIRSNAVLAVEVIVSASPAYFRPDAPERAGHFDQAKLQAWRESVEPWIAKEFPHAVSVVLHLDEATPHYQIIDVPLDARGKLNARGKYGGKDLLSAWQDRAAGAVAALGIERGIPGSLATHERVSAFYGAANQPTPPLPAVTTPKPVPLPARSLAERAPMTEAKAARDAAEIVQAEQLAQRQSEIRARQVEQLRTWPHLAERSNAVDLAQRKQRDAEATAAAKDAEARRLKGQADMLRALPIADVLRMVYGAELRQGSKDQHRSRTFVLPDDRKIAVSKAENGGDVWIEQGSGTGQRGAINLVMHLDGLDYRGAVRLLAEHFDSTAVASDHARVVVQKAARDVAQIAADPVPAPPSNAERWPHVRRWLASARALPLALVDWLHDRGSVHADERGNAVFPRAAGGAFVRGTSEARFHRTIGGKACGAFVLDGDGPTWLCESAIDAASIKAHAPDARVIALGGGLLAPADVADQVPADRPVILAFDADAQGRVYEAAGRALWPSAEVRPPPGGEKDWNAALSAFPALVDHRWSQDEPARTAGLAAAASNVLRRLAPR